MTLMISTYQGYNSQSLGPTGPRWWPKMQRKQCECRRAPLGHSFPWSPRKEWNHYSNWRMASNWCRI